MQHPTQMLGLQVRSAAPVARPRADRDATVPLIALAALLAGLGLGMFVGSLLVAVTVTVLAVGAIGSHAMRGSWRGMREASQQRRRRYARRRQRDRRLEIAGARLDVLAELTELVQDIERTDPALASRFELHELLDQCVGLAIGLERCRGAMRMADRDQLVRELAQARAALTGRGDRRRPELLERRIRCWDESKRRADALVEEIAAIGEFIRLLGQRSAYPDSIDDDDGLGRRLADLDEQDRAYRQLIDNPGDEPPTIAVVTPAEGAEPAVAA